MVLRLQETDYKGLLYLHNGFTEVGPWLYCHFV